MNLIAHVCVIRLPSGKMQTRIYLEDSAAQEELPLNTDTEIFNSKISFFIPFDHRRCIDRFSFEGFFYICEKNICANLHSSLTFVCCRSPICVTLY